MPYPINKISLKKQKKTVAQSKRLKNHDRILYINGLFSPPKLQENSVGLAKESEEWRSLFTMFLIAGFGAVMLLISVIGNYGILATNRLETLEQTLIQALDSMQLDKILMNEEIAALKTNPAYIELIARKQLGLVRKGEVVFYLPESSKSNP